MASDLGDGDYLGAYRRFFVDFLDKVNPDDQLPIKTSGHDVTEAEIAGEIIHMTLQYINQELCPPSLQCYIVQQVIEEIKATCRKEPESCGFRQEDKTYAPLKLMQAITGKVNEICQRYLENSRLALLPPPPSTPMPLATAYAIRNTRRKMEDRHVILHDLNTIFNIKSDSVASYYAVFDGHAGYQAAVYCAAHLHQYLAESRHYPTDPERALRDAFIMTDTLFIQKSTRQTLSSGTTAVCALILNKKLYVAWAGDSQAALAKRGVVTQLVDPHKPDRNDERERVENMGGTVMHLGTWRVNGNLAVSRAIGDAQYKPYVTGTPEICCITLDGYEDFLIIACDGLWDCVTEDEAAALVYREIYRNPYDYESVSQRLVEYSKGQGSVDNITVIVVFLTAPIKISSRPHYGNPLLADVQLDNMEPDNRFMSNANGQFDVNSPFVKQSSAKDSSPDLMDDDDHYGNYGNKSSNGKRHENGGLPVADYDDEDLGPETDVDAIDDASEPGPTLADVSRQLFPEKQDPCELYQADEGMDEDSSPSPQAKKTNQQALIPEADNVADSEDSEDEWNYYRIDPNKEKETTGAAGFTPLTKEDNENIDNVVVSSSPSDHDDILDIEKERESAHNDSDSSSEADSEREVRENVLIESEISTKNVELNPSAEPETLLETEDKENQQEQQQVENKLLEEDMDFQLNPNAAEFVPVSPTPIIARSDLDAPIAGSPLKQTPLMDDIKIPSRREFENEVRHRPGEIEEKSSTNGQLLEELDDGAISKSEVTPSMNVLNDSEISSTKAEYGDESSFLTASELHRTGVSNFDGSFTESYGGFDESSVDPMTKSFGPEGFMNLGNPVDLNAVHDLSDADLLDEENGAQDDGERDNTEAMNSDLAELKQDCQAFTPSKIEFSPENETREILNTSSPIPLHANEFQREMSPFGNESHNHSAADGSISEMLGVACEKEETLIDSTVNVAEEAVNQQQIISDKYDETNVTSKLLEMDLEDRGSQDCEFEKCNEKLRVESSANSEISDFMSSPVTEENLIESCVPESLPMSSTNVEESSKITEVSEKSDIDKISESFDNLCANVEFEPEINTAPDVPVLQNPLTLNFDSASTISQENYENSPSTDYRVAKAPESPAVVVSPLHEQSDNLFVNEAPHYIENRVHENFDKPEETEQTQKSEIESFASSMHNFSDEVSSPNEHFGKITSEQPEEISQTDEKIDEISEKANTEINEILPETEEPINVSSGLKLSESLQEFTGLEQQLNPEKVTNGLQPTENLLEIHNEESKNTEIPSESQNQEQILQKGNEQDEKQQTQIEEPKKENEESSNIEKASIAAAAAAATTVAAVAATKTTKAKPASKTAAKPTTTTKTTTNKSMPTSPTKPASRAAATAGVKKTSTTTSATRPTKLETGTKTGATSAPPSKSTAAPKSTLSAPKTASRLSGVSPRAKLSSTTNSAKSTASVAEKKPTTNGEATKTTVKSATAKVPNKPLVKPASASARQSSATTTAAKPRLPSTTSATNKVPSKTTTAGTTTQRPKTAPAGGSTTLAAKSRLASTNSTSAKMPVTEKQIKETANKQISSSRTSTTMTATKTSRTSVSSSTTTTTRRVAASKTTSTTASAAVPPPIKKPAPITRLGAKTAAANAKTNAGKITSTTVGKTKVVVQNGVCKTAEETKIVTSTTETLTNDSNEDVPKKDLSPVEIPTDNQLIITAD